MAGRKARQVRETVTEIKPSIGDAANENSAQEGVAPADSASRARTGRRRGRRTDSRRQFLLRLDRGELLVAGQRLLPAGWYWRPNVRRSARQVTPHRYPSPNYMRKTAGDIYGGEARQDSTLICAHAGRVIAPQFRGYRAGTWLGQLT